jgi:putative ABC transport system ATP-binding protein
MKMIAARNIMKSYYSDSIENRVLKNISFSMDSGDFICIVGRSGSGKSTLLNVLSTLLKPDKGYVYYGEVDLTNLPEKRKDRVRQEEFGMIFQFHHLMPYLTVLENVLLPYMNHLKPVAKPDIERAKHCLDRVGLGDKYARLPGQLSGGEQQRVAIARALVRSPQVLFADEPTGNLDKKTGDTVVQLLKQLNEEGLSILMVTHEASYRVYANRVIVLEDGVLREASEDPPC